MDGKITKVSYVRKIFEDTLDTKQEVRKKIADIFSLLPQQMFTSLHDNVCPKFVRNKRFLNAVLGGDANIIPLDTSYMLNIKKPLFPIEEIIKDDNLICERMMENIEEYRDIFSQQTIDHIQKKAQDFLIRRKVGIEMFYKNHNCPENLLEKLLCKYLPLDNKEQNIETIKGYLDNKNMQIYLDTMYGTIYLFMASNFVKKYQIDSAGTFGKEYFTGEDEEIIDDDEESIVVPSLKEIYYIFAKGTGYLDSIVTHERQHLINDIVGEYDTDDFLVSAQNEIVAYIKQGIDSIGTKYMIKSADSYKYYQEALDQKEKYLKIMEERLIRYKENKTPKVIIEGLAANIQKNKEDIKIYKEKNILLREEYLTNIEGYIDIAYKFQEANITNYITLLAMTPIRQWKSLLKTYTVK